MQSIPQLFVDLDGVLADFDLHYFNCFGVLPKQDTYEPPDMWDRIRAHGNFYGTIPPFIGYLDFWGALLQFHDNPIVLTGIPYSVPNVTEQKREWVSKYLGEDVEVKCCRSVDKNLHMKNPGDVLIDDRTKYMNHWVKVGGVFVHHTSFPNSLKEVERVYTGSNRPPAKQPF